jgi:putative phosphonate catabolism associated alcohol dehydrogenase
VTGVLELDATAMVFRGPGTPHVPLAVPRVVLEAGELLVAVELATVCGSDVHTVAGARPGPTPSVLGHEFVGAVVAVGPSAPTAVDGTPLTVGDRVVWSLTASCAECDRCRRGLSQKCRDLRKYGHEAVAGHWELSGGFATHVHLRRGTAVVRIDERVPAAVMAPVTCGGATAWAAVRAAQEVVPLTGARVLVTGGGLIGLNACAMATDLGARVSVADPDPERRRLATDFGAHGSPDGTYDVVIEASGARSAVAQALDVVDTGGVVVLVGSVLPTPAVDLDPERVVRGLLTVRGVHNYVPADLAGACTWAQDRSAVYPLADLVGATYPLRDLDLALARSGDAVRVAVDPTL